MWGEGIRSFASALPPASPRCPFRRRRLRRHSRTVLVSARTVSSALCPFRRRQPFRPFRPRQGLSASPMQALRSFAGTRPLATGVVLVFVSSTPSILVASSGVAVSVVVLFLVEAAPSALCPFRRRPLTGPSGPLYLCQQRQGRHQVLPSSPGRMGSRGHLMAMFSTYNIFDSALGHSHSSIPYAGILLFKIPLPFSFSDNFSLRLIHSKRDDANTLGLADKPGMYLSSFSDRNIRNILNSRCCDLIERA